MIVVFLVALNLAGQHPVPIDRTMMTDPGHDKEDETLVAPPPNEENEQFVMTRADRPKKRVKIQSDQAPSFQLPPRRSTRRRRGRLEGTEDDGINDDDNNKADSEPSSSSASFFSFHQPKPGMSAMAQDCGILPSE